MAKRSLKRTPIPGGSPYIGGSGIAIAADLTRSREGNTDLEGKPLPAAPHTIQLSMSAEARANGELLRRKVQAAIAAGPTRDAIIQFAKLVRAQSHAVLRMPEVQDYFGYLCREGHGEALRRILGDVEGRPGRRLQPYREFYVIGLVDRVRQQQGFDSDAKAARWMAERLPGLALSAPSIRNICSRYRHLSGAFYGSIFVPGEQLTATEFSSPSQLGRKK